MQIFLSVNIILLLICNLLVMKRDFLIRRLTKGVWIETYFPFSNLFYLLFIIIYYFITRK